MMSVVTTRETPVKKVVVRPKVPPAHIADAFQRRQ